ncbi:hypothetical protein [Halobacillus massiliensis]|uniref:hypothetical protein n=1 Tax=Halobacillus massiliensis TaxID=1926286 RepID=UPI0015C4B552|nr:hypothetical protein [Halobacillus massiliensis]
MKVVLAAIIVFGMAAGFFSSPHMYISTFWVFLGLSGLIGVVTMGKTLKELFRTI